MKEYVMTVAQLREALQGVKADLPLVLYCDIGDEAAVVSVAIMVEASSCQLFDNEERVESECKKVLGEMGLGACSFLILRAGVALVEKGDVEVFRRRRPPVVN